MNQNLRSTQGCLQFTFLLLLSGCATTPRLNFESVPALNAQVRVYTFKNLEPLARAYFPNEFMYREGGWSGASRVQTSPGAYSKDEIWTINDRGLNLYLEKKDSTKEAQFADGDRYFPWPAHQQQLFKIRLNNNPDRSQKSGFGVVVERLGIRENGLPVSGLPSALENLSTGEHGWELRTPQGPFVQLPNSLQGYDFEGVAQDFDEKGQREFWFVEEYGPSIFKAGASGQIVRRWSPARDFKAQMSKQSPSPALPWSLRHRTDNRGFEGVAVSGTAVFAAMQSPLSAKGGPSKETGHGNPETPIHRIIRLDRKTGKVEQFAYNHTNASVAAGSKHEDVKIGDLAAIDRSGQRFLVLEHSKKRRHMMLIEAQITSDTTQLEDSIDYEAGRRPYKPLETRIVANLAPFLENYEFPEKAEGITVLDDKTLLIVFDNDHCIEPLLAKKSAAKECENLVVTISLDSPLYAGP
jgi:3-phytase